jgi:hypothetical protein
MIEQLGGQHAQSMLIIRYVKFLQSMKKSSKLAVQFLLQKVSNDVSTITGKNIRYILDRIGHGQDIFNVKTNWLKNNLKFCEIPEIEKWRVNFVEEIINVKQNILSIDHDNDSFFSSEQLSEILDYICTS